MLAVLRDAGCAILQAEPGAGKTTVVPLRLLGQPWLLGQKILLLEPRRVAARAAARRMASLLGEEVGETVGYVTRDDRRTGRLTRVEVVTDGILTRRLQRDPGLSGVGLVIFDEFHERHMQADLGLALALDSRTTLRPDLRLLIMSATLDARSLGELLGAAVVSSTGRNHPVELRWRPRRPGGRLAPATAAAVHHAVQHERGDVLVFLPGIGEIRQTAAALGPVPEVEVLELHGQLSSLDQDRALRPGSARRVILATDLAESSVTVEGVGVVIDAGLARRPAFDPASGLTRLTTVTASRSSADQRSGRAGRTRAGVAFRLWAEADHPSRRAWPDPEIVMVDLAGLALELSVWGTEPGTLTWLTPPPPAALASARQLLADLGALESGRPTDLGRRMTDLPLHPRLARMLLVAPVDRRRTATALAALLTERDILARDSEGGAHTADLAVRVAMVDGGEAAIPVLADRRAMSGVHRRAAELSRRLEGVSGASSHAGSPAQLAGAGAILAEAYPDRLAQRRAPGRYRLRHGSGAVLPNHDSLGSAEWLVVAEIEGGSGTSGRADGLIRLAAGLDREDVERIGAGSIRTDQTIEWDERLDDLRVTTRTLLGALDLGSSRHVASPGPETTAALVKHAVASDLRVLGWTPAARGLQSRVTWARQALGEAWPDVTDGGLAARTEEWLVPLLRRASDRRDLARVDPSLAIRSILGRRIEELDRVAPSHLRLESGRSVLIDYRGDRPRAAVRAQHLFGTTLHPSVGAGRIPVTLEILSPAGRPIQITADLPGFWTGSWSKVRQEMAARYPKHSWPVDPGSRETRSTAPPGSRRRR